MKRRSIYFVVCLLIGLSISLGWVSIDLSPLLAQNPPLVEEAAGRTFYENHQFTQAIEQWQAARENYEAQGNAIGQARVLSNLALAYRQIGLWTEAETALKQSFSRLDRVPHEGEALAIFAQALNNQGLVQLARGQTSQALQSWQSAHTVYRSINDEIGIFQSQINQALALKLLGLYPRSCQTLAKALTISESICQKANHRLPQPPLVLPPSLSPGQITAWRMLAETLEFLGRKPPAETIFTELLSRSIEPAQKARLYLDLGNRDLGQGKSEEALSWYEKVATETDDPRLLLQSYLARLKIYLDRRQSEPAIALLPRIQTSLEALPVDHDRLSATINLSNSLVQLREIGNAPGLPTETDIARQLSAAAESAKDLGSPRLQSLALGYLGAIYERQQQYTIARQITEQALLIAQANNAPEITYRWQWQLGRILASQGDTSLAIESYTASVQTLTSIEQDLVDRAYQVRFSFRKEIEPVYRQLVSLLLQPKADGEISPNDLERAKNTIESLRVAELNNFFREACLTASPRSVETIDPEAAIIYPIILADRLAVIFSLPHQPLRYHISPIKAEILEKTVNDYRFNLVVRSRRDFFASARTLYQWLIQPIESQLTDHHIQTLVFVLDGVLRNVPMSALYDGQQYLLEKYQIARNSGLELSSAQRVQQTGLFVLAAGLTQARDGFPPLYYVADELKTIQNNLKSDILLDEAFTIEALEEAILSFAAPIVHIATHGQFSSNFEDTFILAWNGRIDVGELDRLLRSRGETGERAIELLVLSACETATGDDLAALGLAGLAVRSGASSTIATLWTVNDEGATEFMNQFYRGLVKDKLTKAAALRQAQLSLLSNPRFKHPFYWSAYVLLGNWL